MYLSKILVPIKPPEIVKLTAIKQPQDYLFYDNLFKYFDYCGYTVFQDNHQQWGILFTETCATRDDLKKSRQILRPHYLHGMSLPIMDQLTQLGLEVRTQDFDKGYGHVLFHSDQVQAIPLHKQLQIANYDGEDDPEVCHTIHFLDNTYQGQATRFVSGIETMSFATITENNYYAEHIWPTQVGDAYLLLFYYFKEYKVCPSKQMMPRLLCNLWQSTEINNLKANPSLYKSLRL